MWPIMPTPNRGTLSIIGLYNWDDHIFDQLALPPGVDFTDVTQNILMECGELETIYPDWEFMYNAIGFWSDRELPTWEHIYEMTQAEYNPIENYDRKESEIEQENSKEAMSRSSHTASRGSSSASGNSENKVAGFNSDTLATQSGASNNNVAQSEGSGTVVEADQGDTNKDRSRQFHAHGNIGTMTVSQMMAGELSTYPKINIVAYITQAFKERFCLMVY